MQDEITGNDSEVNVKVDVMAAFTFVDSLQTIRAIAGPDFTGYTDDLSADARSRLLKRAMLCSGDSPDCEIQTTYEYDEYDDAFIPLRGIDNSPKETVEDIVQKMIINYFSIVGTNNATKDLSRCIYTMIDKTFGGKIIYGYEKDACPWGLVSTLTDDDSIFFEQFRDMPSSKVEGLITRGLSGSYTLRMKCSKNYYDTITLPSNRLGLNYLREHYRISNERHEHLSYPSIYDIDDSRIVHDYCK